MKKTLLIAMTTLMATMAFAQQKGTVSVLSYQSQTIGEERTMRVWTPAGYEAEKDSLPVLYLVHGGGDDDTGWIMKGDADKILDEYMEEGKMKPMVVVMPNGSIKCPNFLDEVPLFAKDMTTDIIPLIEKHFRVLRDKDHRAMAGLSMGGMETLETMLLNPTLFGYVWVLSSSFAPGSDFHKEAERLNLAKNAEVLNKGLRKLVFTQGGPRDIAYKNGMGTRKEFDEAGIKYEYNEVEGGHSWIAWKQNLRDLLPYLFNF